MIKREFPPNITFEFPWRPYQARVLEELEAHLDDNHLNIVAAPGSGKTILGLEVMLRIDKPTLILAPSIAIRNQWVHRFTEHFLNTEKPPEWISTSIKQPKFLTVSTYQGLHAAFSGKKELKEEELAEEEGELVDVHELKNDQTDAERVIESLKKQGLQTIVIDEAHHLRNEWWKSLVILKEGLDKPHVVALTATPPYDVSPEQWHRYQNLCGQVDAEIPVPELVEAKNLCPHQDYIYLNQLSESEEETILQFKQSVLELFEHIKQSPQLLQIVREHPCLKDPDANIEKILKQPDYFSSLVIYLKACSRYYQFKPEFFKILGTKERQIPQFSIDWAEILLENMFYNDEFFQEHHKDFLDELKQKVKKCGAIEKRRVFLKENREIKSLLKESANKLDSILEIVKLEHQKMGSSLRMVILADFIRKEFMPGRFEHGMPITKLGVIPIFETIRQNYRNTKKIAVLTGSMVIIPYSAKKSLIEIAQQVGIAESHLKFKALASSASFMEVKIQGENNQNVVHLITQLFGRGEIEILVGTQALLGEGWDAPTLNTLVLASVVGSFMLSNQMRGRAIRVNKNEPDKVSNIWHLVSVEKVDSKISSQWNDSIEAHEAKAGYDFRRMKRRFKAFVGVSFKEDLIENGIERMNFGLPPFSEEDVKRLNETTFAQALNRKALTERWQKILEEGEVKQVVPELEAQNDALPRPFIFAKNVKKIIRDFIFIFVLLAVMIISPRFMGGFEGLKIIILFIWGLGLIGLIKAIRRFSRSIKVLIRHWTLARSFKQIATVVLKTLCRMEAIKTDVNRISIKTQQNSQNQVFCHLDGGTSYEKTLFLDALEELLHPVENPRYILARKGQLASMQQQDFHAIPSVIGSKRRWADYFGILWQKYVGENVVIYTRTMEGRKWLLKARENGLADRFKTRSERRNRWR